MRPPLTFASQDRIACEIYEHVLHCLSAQRPIISTVGCTPHFRVVFAEAELKPPPCCFGVGCYVIIDNTARQVELEEGLMFDVVDTEAQAEPETHCTYDKVKLTYP